MATAPESEMDITSLLQPRQGYLWKLGGGQETGSKWNRRWFVLRDNVLMYFQAPRDYNGFRDKPNGVVLLDECNVRERSDKTRSHTFMLAHASGESVVLELEFGMPIPPRGRLGVYESDAGTVFQLAHWFPNVAVYDDVHGWNILPHQGDGEFYTNFGDYTVNITVPSDHLVAATGELVNAEDVLTDEMQDRLARAKASTEKVTKVTLPTMSISTALPRT